MGVNTLLKHLSPCLEESHVERFRGQKVAVDGNTFIFRGCYSCSEQQVALGQACTGPVDHLIKRVHMLKHYGVEPWVVLDGRRTPMKDETSKQRRQEREKNLGMAKDFRRQADDASGAEKDVLLQKAQTFFQKSICVTRQMVTNAMAALKKEGVQCMVSPYEADAQVAFLVQRGHASAVITEDSDILVYMAAIKCTAPVLYKLDEFGKCKELGFDPAKLSSLPGTNKITEHGSHLEGSWEIGKFGRGLSAFAGEGGGRSFVQLAALAGCDYIDNVRGLGLLSALPIITKFRVIPADKRVSRILMHLHKMGKTVPEGHRQRMLLAEMSFFWHRVYDPRSKTCVHFCEAAPELIGTAEIPALPTTAGATAFLGEHIENEMVVSISEGKVDPVSGELVTAEAVPPPESRGEVRRSSTHQPSRSAGSGYARTPKSATMPTTTPVGKRHQQQTGRNNWGEGRPLPQQGRGQSQAWGRRGLQTSDKGRGRGGEGGMLRDMFERARWKAGEENKENVPPKRPDAAGLQDVSEIVLACGSGQTPARGGRVASSRTSTPPAAAQNPFAKKPEGSNASTAASPNPSSFLTPCAFPSGVRPKCDATLPTAGPEGYQGGDSDAWSRLSKGCLMAGTGADPKSAAGRAVSGGVCLTSGTSKEGSSPPEKGAASRDTPESASVEPLAPKRPPSQGANGGRRAGKKAKSGSRAAAGQGATMLSFFGRVALSRP
ncbi:unnamed protein product [Scytosiphon promiscuus]